MTENSTNDSPVLQKLGGTLWESAHKDLKTGVKETFAAVSALYEQSSAIATECVNWAQSMQTDAAVLAGEALESLKMAVFKATDVISDEWGEDRGSWGRVTPEAPPGIAKDAMEKMSWFRAKSSQYAFHSGRWISASRKPKAGGLIAVNSSSMREAIEAGRQAVAAAVASTTTWAPQGADLYTKLMAEAAKHSADASKLLAEAMQAADGASESDVELVKEVVKEAKPLIKAAKQARSDSLIFGWANAAFDDTCYELVELVDAKQVENLQPLKTREAKAIKTAVANVINEEAKGTSYTKLLNHQGNSLAAQDKGKTKAYELLLDVLKEAGYKPSGKASS